MENLGIPGLNLNAITSGAGGFALSDVGNFGTAANPPAPGSTGHNMARVSRSHAATAR